MADAASSLEKQALERKEKLKALKARKTEKKEDAEKEAEEYADKFNNKRVYMIFRMNIWVKCLHIRWLCGYRIGIYNRNYNRTFRLKHPRIN